MEKKELRYYQDKLFIGGLSFKTTDQSLEKYFSKYGAVKQANVMKYTDRQVSRGFGFCIFEDPQSAELAMETKVHVIDGRKVDVRWALPKEMAPPPQASVEQVSKPAVRKIFVGGLSVDTHDNDLRDYFSQFGEIENATVMYHHDKRHSRCFGFVLFKNSSSVNALMQAGPHIIHNKTVDVKKAYPKDELANQSEPSETIQEPSHRDSFSSHSFSKPAYSLSTHLPSDSSPYSFSHILSHIHSLQNDLQLEFFDEQDNNPLPSYSNSYFPSNDLNSPLNQYNPSLLDPYLSFDTDWNTTQNTIPTPTQNSYLYDPSYSYKQSSPNQLHSISGDTDLYSFSSTGGNYQHPLSSFGMRNSSLLSPTLEQTTHNMSFFDSVNSTGSRNGLSKHTNFASQRAFMGSDSGIEDLHPDSQFYSNGGKISFGTDFGESSYRASYGLESDYNGYSLKPSTQLSIRHFDHSDGEEIDSILNESLGNRTFSKQRRSKNHLIFNSGTEESLDLNPFNDGDQGDV